MIAIKVLKESDFWGFVFDPVGLQYQPSKNVHQFMQSKTGDRFYLVQEPNNRHDSNAFCVCLNKDLSTKVGYFPAVYAAKLAPVWNKLRKAMAAVGNPNMTLIVTIDRGKRNFYTKLTITDVEVS